MADLRATVAALGATVLFLCSSALGDDTVAWSPDHKLYAVDSPGEQVGKGRERQRLVVFTDRGEKIAIAHVWEVEPDGTARAGIRGCESWGWVDSAGLFCEGTISPYTGVYLVFEARSGRELQELTGTGFVWSPDRSRIAAVGDARQFSAVEGRSNSIEVQGEPLYPIKKDTEQHWFRSKLAWSPDSRYVAVVDHRQKQGVLYLVLTGVGGSRFEQKLRWQEKAEDYPPALDFSVSWTGKQVMVEHGGATQAVVIAH